MAMTATTPKKTSTRTVNVRVPASIYQKLEILAKSTARTKSLLMVEALSNYLESQSWQIKEIEAGIADADRGEFASDAQVIAVFAKYGA